MSDVVIKVENLWKEYRLGVVNHGTLKRDLQSWWARVRGHDDPNIRIDVNAAGRQSSTALEAPDRFWALRDVSFDVRQGEVLGIIGRNGAGKSTLLKILSRVTTPTKGEVKIRGRVASLLEVGTGFHPELTGRENIFLNGAILGMSKAEIRAKFDEIVDFSGVEKFIDTPVKRYSSGMYVRLAFAVAAHLEPEILIIDEVLAVGDAEFQKKCLGKMGEVAKGGRTVLFVSHNMGAIHALCSRGIMLQSGEKLVDSGADLAVSSYLVGGDSTAAVKSWINGVGEGPVKLHEVRMTNSKRELSTTCGINEDLFVEIKYLVLEEVKNVRVGFRLVSPEGTVVFTSENTDGDSVAPTLQIGNHIATAKIPGDFLNEGTYSITVGSHIPMVKVFFFEENIFNFKVENTGGVGGFVDDKRQGLIRPRLEWQNATFAAP